MVQVCVIAEALDYLLVIDINILRDSRGRVIGYPERGIEPAGVSGRGGVGGQLKMRGIRIVGLVDKRSFALIEPVAVKIPRAVEHGRSVTVGRKH